MFRVGASSDHSQARYLHQPSTSRELIGELTRHDAVAREDHRQRNITRGEKKNKPARRK
jgi:hypothetical protein